MLHNIKPKQRPSKEASLSTEEKPMVKGLLEQGYRPQDILHIINQGRIVTINPGRIAEIKTGENIIPASNEDIRKYIIVQSSYDPHTLLNPYKDERLIRARDAMISAVQIFNSPTITFKTEIFATFAHIAWTYLVHEKMERTKSGSTQEKNGKSISLSAAIKKEYCPIKHSPVIENIKKIIDIRNAVEHTFLGNIDDCYGALFQSCCLNFDKHMTDWFGKHLSLSKNLSLSLQFVKLDKEQIVAVENENLPEKIRAINSTLQNNIYANDTAFQLTVHFTTEITSKTGADIHQLVENYDTDKCNKNTTIKKTALSKITETELITLIHEEGFLKFTRLDHQKFWKKRWGNAHSRDKNATEYGELFQKSWGWYKDRWLSEVLKHCKSNKEQYIKPPTPDLQGL